MRTYFFDTSALQHRYCQDDQWSRRVKQLVSDHRNDCHIAEWTMLEAPSALARRCRRSNWGLKEFDRMNAAFYNDVAAGLLVVRTTTRSDVVRAQNLIRFAGVRRRRNLNSADALIAICCLGLALELRTPVVFLTSDWPLYSVLRDVNAFRVVLELRYVGVPKAGLPAATPIAV